MNPAAGMTRRATDGRGEAFAELERAPHARCNSRSRGCLLQVRLIHLLLSSAFALRTGHSQRKYAITNPVTDV